MCPGPEMFSENRSPDINEKIQPQSTLEQRLPAPPKHKELGVGLNKDILQSSKGVLERMHMNPATEKLIVGLMKRPKFAPVLNKAREDLRQAKNKRDVINALTPITEMIRLSGGTDSSTASNKLGFTYNINAFSLKNALRKRGFNCATGSLLTGVMLLTVLKAAKNKNLQNVKVDVANVEGTDVGKNYWQDSEDSLHVIPHITFEIGGKKYGVFFDSTNARNVISKDGSKDPTAPLIIKGSKPGTALGNEGTTYRIANLQSLTELAVEMKIVQIATSELNNPNSKINDKNLNYTVNAFKKYPSIIAYSPETPTIIAAAKKVFPNSNSLNNNKSLTNQMKLKIALFLLENEKNIPKQALWSLEIANLWNKQGEPFNLRMTGRLPTLIKAYNMMELAYKKGINKKDSLAGMKLIAGLIVYTLVKRTLLSDEMLRKVNVPRIMEICKLEMANENMSKHAKDSLAYRVSQIYMVIKYQGDNTVKELKGTKKMTPQAFKKKLEVLSKSIVNEALKKYGIDPGVFWGSGFENIRKKEMVEIRGMGDSPVSKKYTDYLRVSVLYTLLKNGIPTKKSGKDKPMKTKMEAMNDMIWDLLKNPLSLARN